MTFWQHQPQPKHQQKRKGVQQTQVVSAGYVSVFVLLTGMILILITLSLLTRQMNEVKAVASFQDKTQAHYLATSGMDMALWQLYEWSEEAVLAYEEGVRLAAETGVAVPSLKNYIRSHVVQRLYKLNAFNTRPSQNFIPQVEQEHSLRMRVVASIDGELVTLTVQGVSQKARITQQAVVQLPRVVAVEPLGPEGQNGNLVTIHGLNLVSRFQTFSIWY